MIGKSTAATKAQAEEEKKCHCQLIMNSMPILFFFFNICVVVKVIQFRCLQLNSFPCQMAGCCWCPSSRCQKRCSKKIKRLWSFIYWKKLVNTSTLTSDQHLHPCRQHLWDRLNFWRAGNFQLNSSTRFGYIQQQQSSWVLGLIQQSIMGPGNGCMKLKESIVICMPKEQSTTFTPKSRKREWLLHCSCGIRIFFSPQGLYDLFWDSFKKNPQRRPLGEGGGG